MQTDHVWSPICALPQLQQGGVERIHMIHVDCFVETIQVGIDHKVNSSHRQCPWIDPEIIRFARIQWII